FGQGAVGEAETRARTRAPGNHGHTGGPAAAEAVAEARVAHRPGHLVAHGAAQAAAEVTALAHGATVPLVAWRSHSVNNRAPFVSAARSEMRVAGFNGVLVMALMLTSAVGQAADLRVRV